MSALLNEEQTYRYQERLGILCGSGPVTDEAEEIALMEALELAEEGTELS